ncbi:hypothetical protein [Paludisphaera mucosa]|uniref:Tetratricopeptide repeat protein n=1 Tax=Paludisphaera mucosa TaxID=3030827 RepID=A0ABT6F5Y0_9BACT|nr:hypothetical protein [Paludisphaera mucosa]MDG3002927.1 hypothetical protein [Paludisphaera mucosa]
MRRRLPILCGLLFVLLGASVSARAQTPETDDETANHLAAMKQRLDDPTIDLDVREDLALETAGTLDRAARAESKLDSKLARWNAAVDLLDDFGRKNPEQARRRDASLQAAVYRWAEARAWHDQRDLFPAQVRSSSEEASALDDAIARLRLIVGGEPGALTDNVRFRLAWALTDRADLEDAGSPTTPLRRQEALELLKQPPSEPSLAGFHALLKAELLREEGQLDEAAGQIAVAAKAASPPPDSEILDVLIPILVARKGFAEARKTIDAMRIPDPLKALHRVRIDLAEWKAAEPGPAGSGRRRELEADALKQVQSLRAARAPETRVALAELARQGAVFEPDAAPAFWDAVAEGYEVLGDAASAAAMSEKAAARAERDGRHVESAASRLRAGGFLFQAGKYAEAASLLEKVVADRDAGASRPRASLLQSLARGRASAAGGSMDLYEKALQRHLQEFPDDPTAVEARWMLGGLEQSRGRREQALALWKAVPIESPRWGQARTAAAEAFRHALEDRVAAEERDGLEGEYVQAKAFLDESLQLARGRSESDRADLLLCQARLNLVPIVGKPALTRDAAEECLGMNVTPAQRYQARLARMVAFAALGRYVEAEREAQQHPTWAEPEGRAAFLDAVRQIDLAAAAADTDLLQRRLGLVARLLIGPLLQDASLPDELRNELTFRMARALLFQGDARTAQATLQNWSPSTGKADDRFLKDLADAYFRLEANELAIDVERLRIKKLKSGSHAWFDARYGLALAYYRLGRKQDTLQLIEGTAILHPELGGGRVKEKFIRLRQRLGSAP